LKIEYPQAVDQNTMPTKESCRQGDQIGRIFAHCMIVYLGSFLKITGVAQIFGTLFSTVKVMQ
jgi:hypothetical protein